MAYFMAIVLMFLKVILMVGMGILNLFSSAFIDGMCSGSGASSDYDKGVDFPSSSSNTID
jgi:hypothetical protein